MNRYASLRQIVIANGIHAPEWRKHATQGRQFLRRTDADRAVAFNVQPRQLIGVGQLFVQRRVISSIARLTSATISSSGPYRGTSCWYIADIACGKLSRIIQP